MLFKKGSPARWSFFNYANNKPTVFCNPNARCISPKCALHLSKQHVAFSKQHVAFEKMLCCIWLGTNNAAWCRHRMV